MSARVIEGVIRPKGKGKTFVWDFPFNLLSTAHICGSAPIWKSAIAPAQVPEITFLVHHTPNNTYMMLMCRYQSNIVPVQTNAQ